MSVELRAVLFDMDGTLVDTEGMWWEACVAVAAELGLELSEAEIDHVLGRAAEHVAAHLLRRAPSSPAPSSPVPDALSPPAPDARPVPADARPEPADARLTEVGVRLIEAFAERIAEGVTPLPGAIRLLDDLGAAGMPVALVSASPRQIVDMVLRTIGAERFALVVAAEDTVRAKPLPDPYLKAAAALGLDPAVCVAVEDSPTGLAAAHAAGCRVVAVSDAMPVPYDVLIVDSLERVDLPLLRRLAGGRTSVG
ncbi:HAD family hydrolase [Streptosporangium lutulentum]|uniref:HAD superfamily hydrolase (TIGR01509 family) n=1 Tax=Streptosporangium lutulentum TaxID=1461250 RepID=A0ABT9QTJ7_9ACTN|nr:HAD family phosphatase [Streptosporangium lutulentum]MDP9850075.1 HAD superfamily hydrolase (TIGR01509 family) [Streptosporangium lutulentum]